MKLLIRENDPSRDISQKPSGIRAMAERILTLRRLKKYSGQSFQQVAFKVLPGKLSFDYQVTNEKLLDKKVDVVNI